MSLPLLATKLYVPPPRPQVVLRSRLIDRLTAGLHCKLTLISAPAGFGKTTLVSEWAAGCKRPVAWLSLDEADGDPTRFLTYLVAALQTIAPALGAGLPDALQSAQPPPAESVLTALLNEIGAIPNQVVLVLDDYHVIDARSVDDALLFLLKHLPPQVRLVITTREDPPLPLARLRARGHLAELRAADLRFTPAEAAAFLNEVMGLGLSAPDIAALEARTEGWIAGLHLAALSLQGQHDAARFIASFTGSHHFVLDYLVEEVLQRQPERVQSFLLRTSVLDRLCGPLCDAVLREPAGSGQTTLGDINHANLFVVPLDSERRWYRYHHLFGDLLRTRLGRSHTPEAIAAYHVRASQWYEEHDLAPEAFHHAAAANDVDRAQRLIESRRMPLHLRTTVTTILDWLYSLPQATLDARPSLWVKSATLALAAGQTTGVAERLQAAERALPPGEPDGATRNLLGVIAAARATLAVTQYQAEIILAQSRRALEYLAPDNLPFRFTAVWAMAFAHHLQGDRAAAGRAYREAIAISQASGDRFSIILATDSLGQAQELEMELAAAAESYQRVLELCGDHPQPTAGEARLGLARICYEWNDLEAAERHGQESLRLMRQYDTAIDRFILAEVFLARLQLARGDVPGAAALVEQAEQSVRQRNFMQRMPEVAAVHVLVLLRQGNPAAAAQAAQRHELPLSQARAHLDCSDAAAALALLEPLRRHMDAKGWQDERLKVMALQAVALHAHDEHQAAARLLGEALALAEPGGCIRLFVDEGAPMRLLLLDVRLRIARQAHSRDQRLIGYVDNILAAFTQRIPGPASNSSTPTSIMVEPLSQRELEILRLVAQGLSNQEIGERLVLSLNTVKGHNRRIFDKLQVQRRTEAIARAREFGLL